MRQRKPQKITARDVIGRAHVLIATEYRYYGARVWKDVHTTQLYTVSTLEHPRRSCRPLICEPDELEADE